jgi:hypothetical protein
MNLSNKLKKNYGRKIMNQNQKNIQSNIPYLKVLFCFLTTLLFTMSANAEDRTTSNESTVHVPGASVKTNDRRKEIRVWTTEGPVQVSPAPEPFKDKNDPKINNVDIIVPVQRGILGDSPRRNRPAGNGQIGNGSRGTRNPPPSTPSPIINDSSNKGDSFDLRE